MKGKILIVVGAVLVVFTALWIGGLIPLEIAGYEIRTCPSDGESYNELKTASATTPKIFNFSKMVKVLYFQDAELTPSTLTATQENNEYFWSAPVNNPPLPGSHEFRFEFYGIAIGDVNNDGIISDEDMNLTTLAVSKASYDPKFDLNNDGKLSSADIGILRNNIGKSTSISLLTTISGAFKIRLIPSSEDESPEPEIQQQKLYAYQRIAQLSLLIVGFVLLGSGLYLEKREE